MEMSVISKNAFINSENKDSFMSECLKILVEADMHFQDSVQTPDRESVEIQRKLETLKQEYQAKKSAIQNQGGTGLLAEEERQIQMNQDEIANIQNSMERKFEKLELMRSLTKNRQEHLRNAVYISEEERQSQIRELQNDLEGMERRMESFVQNANVKITQLNRAIEKLTKKRDRIQNEKEVQLLQLKEEYESRMQEAQTESRKAESFAVMQNLTNAIPPMVFNSALHAMDKFELRDLKRSKKYIRQCKMGTICHKCSEAGAEILRSVYPDVVKDGQLNVPYILGRNHAVYQMFLYKREDRDVAWQHFQTLCLGQLVLHRNFDYEMTVLLDGKEGRNESNFLSDIQGFDYQAKIKVIRPQELEDVLGEMNDYCAYVQEHYLKHENMTIWEYNRLHPEKRLPYKGIALWNFPLGANEDILNFLYDMYNDLEKCGIFFLFMVDDGFEGEEAIFRGIQKIMAALPILRYNNAVQGYEALDDVNYVYQIEEYRNL